MRNRTETEIARRVLHVSEALPGGVSTYLNELLPYEIDRLGRDGVGVLCPQYQTDTLSDAVRENISLFPYAARGRGVGSLSRMALRVLQVVRQWRPQIVHAHSTFAGAVCRLLPVTRMPPVVYTPHGWAFEMERPRLQLRAIRTAESLLSKRADAIVAVSEHESAAARRAGIVHKLHTVRSGLGPQAVAQSNSILSRSGPPELLFIGRFDRQKGVDWLLHQYAGGTFGDMGLTVVGAPVHGDAGGVPVPPRVRFTGWVPRSELDRYIDQADAVIMPSRWEAFGFVAVEAMRRAVPVFASNRGALPEIVVDGLTGIVFDLDRPQELSARLMRISRAELHEMGLNGRRRFLEYFTADRMSREIAAIYDRVPLDD